MNESMSFVFPFEALAEEFAEIYYDVCERADCFVRVDGVPDCFVDEVRADASKRGGVERSS